MTMKNAPTEYTVLCLARMVANMWDGPDAETLRHAEEHSRQAAYEYHHATAEQRAAMDANRAAMAREIR